MSSTPRTAPSMEPSYRSTTAVIPSAQQALAAVLVEERPWGHFQRFTLNTVSTVKIITVEPGQSLSLQRHACRGELWVVLDDGLGVAVNGATWMPAVGELVYVAPGVTHMLFSAGPRIRVLEVALGHFDEDDIERMADVYGRC